MDDTLTSDLSNSEFGLAEVVLQPCLTVLWSRDEPERIGEVASLAQLATGQPCALGRAGGRAADEHRVVFARVRPGQRAETGELRASTISRRQLHLSGSPGEGVRVSNLGRGELRVNGEPCASAELTHGDRIELGRRLLLAYAVRPSLAAGPAPAAPLAAFPFGQADAHGLVGESPQAWALRAKLHFVARRDHHVLIVGASGTGKELVAKAIHALSRRSQRPLLARNAATIPESLIDAELFGNLRDYPNPGMRERRGLIGEADGGGLFLDEIGELPHELQAHLLRVMELGEYQRLGDAQRRTADVRLLAATNRELAALKHDFLARFTLRVETSGLDERREDIPLILRHLIDDALREDPELAGDLARRAGVPTDTLALTPSLGLVEHLVQRPYTTHVRELSELLWRSLAEYEPPYLRVPEAMRAPTRTPRTPTPPLPTQSDETPSPEAIEQALRQHGWVLEDTWRALGLRNRHQLRRLMDRHAISPPRTHVDPASLSRSEVEAALARCEGVKEQAWRELGLRSRHQLNRLLKRYEAEDAPSGPSTTP